MWKPPDLCVPFLWEVSAPTTQSAHRDDGETGCLKVQFIILQFRYILLFSQAQKQSEVFYTDV